MLNINIYIEICYNNQRALLIYTLYYCYTFSVVWNICNCIPKFLRKKIQNWIQLFIEIKITFSFYIKNYRENTGIGTWWQHVDIYHLCSGNLLFYSALYLFYSVQYLKGRLQLFTQYSASVLDPGVAFAFLHNHTPGLCLSYIIMLYNIG